MSNNQPKRPSELSLKREDRRLLEAQTAQSISTVIQLLTYFGIMVLIVGGAWGMFNFEAAQFVAVAVFVGFVTVALYRMGDSSGKRATSDVAAETLRTTAVFNQSSSRDKQAELRGIAEMFKALKQDTMMQRQAQQRDWAIFQREMKMLVEQTPGASDEAEAFLVKLQELRDESDADLIDTEYNLL
jgi:hypothetical protein